jgi:hypothetical protein
VTVPNTSGTVTFQLVVVDNLGVSSAPVTQTVTIQSAPIAVLTATPSPVAPGGTITLSGAGSTTTGTIAQYNYTLLTPGAAPSAPTGVTVEAAPGTTPATALGTPLTKTVT